MDKKMVLDKISTFNIRDLNNPDKNDMSVLCDASLKNKLPTDFLQAYIDITNVPMDKVSEGFRIATGDAKELSKNLSNMINATIQNSQMQIQKANITLEERKTINNHIMECLKLAQKENSEHRTFLYTIYKLFAGVVCFLGIIFAGFLGLLLLFSGSNNDKNS